MKRDIKSVNRLIFFINLTFCLTVMSLSHVVGGRSYLYDCLRLPLFAPARGSFLLIVFLLNILCALSEALYINKYFSVFRSWKIKMNILFILFVVLCGLWYPAFFAWKKYFGALMILLAGIILGAYMIKVYSQKCFSAALIMFWAEMIVVYLFFLQLCINILN